MYILQYEEDHESLREATGSYIDEINRNPYILESPKGKVVRIVEGYFTLWTYRYYDDGKGQYENIGIFHYENKGTGTKYFFHLNTLIQISGNEFTKITYNGSRREIVYQYGSVVEEKGDKKAPAGDVGDVEKEDTEK